MAYSHIFFDLDHTLWDFKTNSRNMLGILYDKFNLKSEGIDSKTSFISKYEIVNDGLWAKYRDHTIDKQTLRTTRFREVLKTWEILDISLADTINEEYLSRSPYQKTLMPGAFEILDYLKSDFELHMITNGFKEIQEIKIRESGLTPYFKEIIISEDVGVQKPHPRIFEHALERAGSSAEDVIYIGDHVDSDIIGSQKAGWDQIFFNPEEQIHGSEPTFEIKELLEMKDIF